MFRRYSLNSWMCMGTYDYQRESDLSLNHWLSHQYSPPLYIRKKGSHKCLGHWKYNIVKITCIITVQIRPIKMSLACQNGLLYHPKRQSPLVREYIKCIFKTNFIPSKNVLSTLI